MTREDKIQENKVFTSFFQGVWGRMLGFSLLAALPVIGVFLVIISSSGVSAEQLKQGEYPGSLVALILVSWPLINAVAGFPAIHLTLKKRINSRIFLLTGRMDFKHLRNAIFKRWFWQVMLFQLGMGVLNIVIESFVGKSLNSGTGFVIGSLLMGFVAQIVTHSFYKKGFFSIADVPASGQFARQ